MAEMAELRDGKQFKRFGVVQVGGTIVDYAVANALVYLLATGEVLAATIGFLIGSAINYIGHNVYSYEHTDRNSISFLGYLRYMSAVGFALLARLAVVKLLAMFTGLPFWLILIAGIGVSFVVSYVLATVWVFRRKAG